MEALSSAIDCTPIIDHHAHNLLLPQELAARQLMKTRFGIEDQLPQDFPDALQRLDKDRCLRSILGEELVNVYLTVKYAEVEMLDGMEDEERRKFLLERY